MREVRLSELFTSPDRPLIVYHLMYGKAQTAACPMCTMWIDGFNGVAGKVTGLFYGDGKQFAAECIGVLTNIAYIAPMTWLVFKSLGATVGNRPAANVEIEGLDIPEMGVLGYEH